MMFFIWCNEFIGEGLIGVVEESRQTSNILRTFNSIFLALIPRFENPFSFNQLKPISLCNCVYKIIYKIIVLRLLILSHYISKEQFGFLEGWQIHDAIRVDQEGIQTNMNKNTKALIIKIDIDWVNWLYLHLLLIHLGFCVPFMSWIISCIFSSSLFSLVNRFDSFFFKSQNMG